MVLSILTDINKHWLSATPITVAAVGVLLCFLVGCIHGQVEPEQEYEKSGISNGEFIEPLGWNYKVQRKYTPDGKTLDVVWY